SDGTTVVTASASYTLAQSEGRRVGNASQANGGPATFSFSVKDNGGTLNGGVDTLAESVAISVTAVNDTPVRTAGSVADLTVLEDTGLTTLGLGALAYSPGPANESSQTLSYTVTAVPASSLGDVVLSDGTTVVTASASYTLAQIQGMKFRTASQANGGPATFSFSVKFNTRRSYDLVDTLAESLAIS